MDIFGRDGLTFDVRDAGPHGGETAVLLHGFPQDGSAWDAVAPALHEAGLRTLAPDQRGYSPGARPRGRAAYRIGECARDVIALLDAAQVQRAHVVGHDWGGAAAWALATRHPDRLLSVTVLSTPHPAALAWAFTHSGQGLRSWYMAFFQLPLLPERLVAPTLARTLERSGLPPEQVARYTARMQEPGALAGALGWYRAMPASMRSAAARPGRTAPPEPAGAGAAAHDGAEAAGADGSAVTVPTTYAWGRRDFALGRAAAERTRRHVAGPYRFVELDAGHWLPETRPTQVATVVLDQVRAVAGG